MRSDCFKALKSIKHSSWTCSTFFWINYRYHRIAFLQLSQRTASNDLFGWLCCNEMVQYMDVIAVIILMTLIFTNFTAQAYQCYSCASEHAVAVSLSTILWKKRNFVWEELIFVFLFLFLKYHFYLIQFYFSSKIFFIF